MDLSEISDSDHETPRTRRRLIRPEDDSDPEDMTMSIGGSTNRIQLHGNTTSRSGGFRSASDMLRSEAHGSTTTTDAGPSSSSRPRLTRPAAVPAAASAASETEDEELDVGPTFKPETLHAIFKQVWSDPGTKAGKDALQLSAEYLRLFTIEALHRATLTQREGEDEELRDEKTVLELDSLESITPQLVLDF